MAEEDAHRALLTEWLTQVQEARQVRADRRSEAHGRRCGLCPRWIMPG